VLAPLPAFAASGSCEALAQLKINQTSIGAAESRAAEGRSAKGVRAC